MFATLSKCAGFEAVDGRPSHHIGCRLADWWLWCQNYSCITQVRQVISLRGMCWANSPKVVA
eukprot:1607268-Amphidinium_carterae.1